MKIFLIVLVAIATIGGMWFLSRKKESVSEVRLPIIPQTQNGSLASQCTAAGTKALGAVGLAGLAPAASLQCQAYANAINNPSASAGVRANVAWMTGGLSETSVGKSVVNKAKSAWDKVTPW